MLNVQKVRKDFPFLSREKEVVYFDSAATMQKPQRVIDCLSEFYAKDYGTVHRAIYELSLKSTELYDNTREEIRSFLNAKEVEEILFTMGTTEGINLVAYTYGRMVLQPGDAVVLSETEHHSNIVPWQFICKEKGAQIHVAPVNDKGEIILEDLEKLLSAHRCKIVAIAHVANSTGVIHPVKEVVALAHKRGAKVLIDGAQSAAHLPIDVQEIDADFYAFSGHKVYGPTGVGILYGKRELLEAMPPFLGGGDMIESVTFERSTFQKPPLKFEAGTPMIAEVIALGEAIRYVKELGLEEISAFEHQLLTYATKQMEAIPGIRIIGTSRNKGAIISFTAEGVHPLDIGTFLDLKGIAIRTGHHCAQPAMKRFQVPATARASFAVYNTFEEIDYFITSLQEVLKQLRAS